MEHVPIHSLPHSLLQSIFGYLGPKDLCRVSATCKLWRSLNRDVEINRVWRSFYSARWKVSNDVKAVSWQSLYGSKMKRLKYWAGKSHQDNLYGHRAGVKCLKLLPSCDLLVTGSLDKTLKLWNLSAGMPLATSCSHGGTVRSVVLDPRVLISGSTDHDLRLWKSIEDAPEPCQIFDISRAPDKVLTGHIGPVSSLCLIDAALYSGSWDYTVRVWSRTSWECIQILKFDDWVCSVAARGHHLLVSAGSDVLVHDNSTGQLVRKFQNLHEGHVSCLEGTRNGKMLFTGAGDGLILGHDLRMKEATVIVWHHNASVNALAFEDPWLASTSSDGVVMLLNTEQGYSPTKSHSSASRMRKQLQAHSSPAYCVDLSDQWLACGGESEVVRTWDFNKGAEVAERARASKAARQAARRRGYDVPRDGPSDLGGASVWRRLPGVGMNPPQRGWGRHWGPRYSASASPGGSSYRWQGSLSWSPQSPPITAPVYNQHRCPRNSRRGPSTLAPFPQQIIRGFPVGSPSLPIPLTASQPPRQQGLSGNEAGMVPAEANEESVAGRQGLRQTRGR